MSNAEQPSLLDDLMRARVHGDIARLIADGDYYDLWLEAAIKEADRFNRHIAVLERETELETRPLRRSA